MELLWCIPETLCTWLLLVVVPYMRAPTNPRPKEINLLWSHDCEKRFAKPQLTGEETKVEVGNDTSHGKRRGSYNCPQGMVDVRTIGSFVPFLEGLFCYWIMLLVWLLICLQPGHLPPLSFRVQKRSHLFLDFNIPVATAIKWWPAMHCGWSG